MTSAAERLSIGLGIFTGQARPGSGRSVADEYRTIVSLARAAEELGFDSVWLSEHHGAEDGYLPSLLPMLAAVAAVTERIGLGTAVLLPALWHPLRLAEDIAVVDQLSRGRLLLGLGLGWRSEEFAAFGTRRADRVGRTTEMVAILRRLWADDPTPFAGRHYRVERMRVRPLPFRPGGPPIHLAGAKEAPVRRAGRLGDALMYSLAGPTSAAFAADLAKVEAALAWCDDERARAHGAGGLPLTLLLNLFVSRRDGWAVIGEGIDHQFRTYAAWGREEVGAPFRPQDEADAIARGRRLVLVGDPAAVEAALGRWVDAIVPQRALHLAVKLHYPGVAEARTREAVELFAREIMPGLRRRADGARLRGAA